MATPEFVIKGKGRSPEAQAKEFADSVKKLSKLQSTTSTGAQTPFSIKPGEGNIPEPQVKQTPVANAGVTTPPVIGTEAAVPGFEQYLGAGSASLTPELRQNTLQRLQLIAALPEGSPIPDSFPRIPTKYDFQAQQKEIEIEGIRKNALAVKNAKDPKYQEQLKITRQADIDAAAARQDKAPSDTEYTQEGLSAIEQEAAAKAAAARAAADAKAAAATTAPTPGTFQAHNASVGNKSELDEISAVKNGTKPVAMTRLKDEAIRAGLSVVPLFKNNTGQWLAVNGTMADALKKQAEFRDYAKKVGIVGDGKPLSSEMKNSPAFEEYHRSLGKFFGYKEQEINEFIAKEGINKKPSTTTPAVDAAPAALGTIESWEKTVNDAKGSLDISEKALTAYRTKRDRIFADVQALKNDYFDSKISENDFKTQLDKLNSAYTSTQKETKAAEKTRDRNRKIHADTVRNYESVKAKTAKPAASASNTLAQTPAAATTATAPFTTTPATATTPAPAPASAAPKAAPASTAPTAPTAASTAAPTAPVATTAAPAAQAPVATPKVRGAADAALVAAAQAAAAKAGRGVTSVKNNPITTGIATAGGIFVGGSILATLASLLGGDKNKEVAAFKPTKAEQVAASVAAAAERKRKEEAAAAATASPVTAAATAASPVTAPKTIAAGKKKVAKTAPKPIVAAPKPVVAPVSVAEAMVLERQNRQANGMPAQPFATQKPELVPMQQGSGEDVALANLRAARMNRANMTQAEKDQGDIEAKQREETRKIVNARQEAAGIPVSMRGDLTLRDRLGVKEYNKRVAEQTAIEVEARKNAANASLIEEQAKALGTTADAQALALKSEAGLNNAQAVNIEKMTQPQIDALYAKYKLDAKTAEQQYELALRQSAQAGEALKTNSIVALQNATTALIESQNKLALLKNDLEQTRLKNQNTQLDIAIKQSVAAVNEEAKKNNASFAMVDNANGQLDKLIKDDTYTSVYRSLNPYIGKNKLDAVFGSGDMDEHKVQYYGKLQEILLLKEMLSHPDPQKRAEASAQFQSIQKAAAAEGIKELNVPTELLKGYILHVAKYGQKLN